MLVVPPVSGVLRPGDGGGEGTAGESVATGMLLRLI
jgi:hypothetical protein